MAGNKVNAKAKGKDDRGKGSFKPIGPNNDETENTDFSLLRKPIQTSVTGFAQARKIFDMATEELKGLLSDECDVIYECKVCRNLFRSLANFISHKRVYCQKKFNSSVHGHFIKSSSTQNEFTKIKHIEDGYQKSLKEVIESEDTEVDDRIPFTKDLTTIVEAITKIKGISENNDDEPQISLHKIPSSTVAVFQNVDTEEKDGDNMINQVKELDDILSRSIAVLQSDGKFKIASSVPDGKAEHHTEGVIQISDDEDGGVDSLKCKKCDMRFSTQKTLKFHMKYKHVDTRIVYPCPDCLEIFSTSWSVYRHLFKVHRKTAAQIRRMRESILAKAFKMNNPPAFYEKRRNNIKTAQVPKITEEERRDQENQAWMDNMECDGEVPRCGGCGRTFERRAALAAHTHTCQPRSRALRRPDAKRIEIQIRKDYNKGPVAASTPLAQPAKTDVNDNKTVKVKDSKEKKEIQEDENQSKTKLNEPDPEEELERNGTKETSPESAMQHSGNETESKSTSASPEKANDEMPQPKPQDMKLVRLPFAQHAEKSNLMALRQRIIPDIELETLRCKKCDTGCDHIQDLYDHVAKHYNWMRYACKLCNFKNYNFEKLPEHVKVVHKLKGDKDFYFSTVKAIDGPEASELATPVDESTEVDETSSNSRRPSRCSSDSSRLSDDSSSSSTRIEGARKRKMTHKMPSKAIVKRRKSFKGTKDADEEWTDKDDSQSNVKAFEENSSDIDDTYERVAKKRVEESVASRRPVRRKAKPKNEDFEYDLSNLLKMEAQGYRESQTVTTTAKSSQNKKKIQPDNFSNYEMLNKECCGALVSLSRKAVENAKAHMKTSATQYIQREKIPTNIFIRPMLPRGLTRGDKLSPKKEVVEEKSYSASSNKEISKEIKSEDLEKNATDRNTQNNEKNATINIKPNVANVANNDNSKSSTEQSRAIATSGNSSITEQNKDLNDSTTNSCEKPNQKSRAIPSVLPLKFRRQSIDVIKNNPIINKNISEFSKAGMKTKILVIKPINRNKDGVQTAVNASLKFQTIKLKDANKSEDKSTDQVVYVKVPQVDCITRSVSETSKVLAANKAATERTLSIPDEPTITREDARSAPDPLKTIKIHADKNGDVKINTSVPMAIESIKSSEDITSKSNMDNSLLNCDNLKLNAECNTKNAIAIASDRHANCEKIDDSL